MDAALKAAQAATQTRKDAQAAERTALTSAKARTNEYVQAVQQDAMAAIGVKSRPGGARRRAVEGDAGGAQVYAMNGAR